MNIPLNPKLFDTDVEQAPITNQRILNQQVHGLAADSLLYSFSG